MFIRTIPLRGDRRDLPRHNVQELLRSFIEVNELRICGALSQELSRALEVDEVELDLGLLLDLQEIVIQFYGKRADNLSSRRSPSPLNVQVGLLPQLSRRTRLVREFTCDLVQ